MPLAGRLRAEVQALTARLPTLGIAVPKVWFSGLFTF